jgi:hypothetical protein
MIIVQEIDWLLQVAYLAGTVAQQQKPDGWRLLLLKAPKYVDGKLGRKDVGRREGKEAGWRTRATADAGPAPCPVPTPGSTRRTERSQLPQRPPLLPVVTSNLQRLAASRSAAINGRTPSVCSDARKSRSKGSDAVSSRKQAEFKRGAWRVRSERAAKIAQCDNPQHLIREPVVHCVASSLLWLAVSTNCLLEFNVGQPITTLFYDLNGGPEYGAGQPRSCPGR